MGRPSALSPYGLHRYGGGRSAAEKIYRAQIAQLTDPKTGQSSLDLSPGTEEEGRIFAGAIAKGFALTALERAGNQGDVGKAVEGLPNLEADYLATPSPGDSIPTRQARLTVLKRAWPGGAAEWSVVNALRTLLGSKFISYFVSPTKSVFPASPIASSQVNAQLPQIPAKFVKLTGPMASNRNVPLYRTIGYTNLDPTAEEEVLEVGDVVMASPNNTVVSEKLTVHATGGVAGARTFTAPFLNAHEMGAIVTTFNFPWQRTFGRRNFVVVDPSVVADAATRAKIDALMPHVLRGVSTWSIVAQGTGAAHTIGPFTLGTSPLGSAPLSNIAFTPSP